MKRIAVLTGGGDAPGLNPAIKGLVYRASEYEIETVGLYDGWRSLLNPMPDVLPLDRAVVRRWDRDGGTNLGSSRTNPFHTLTETGERVDRSGEVLENISRLGLDAIVACGGEDTLGVAARLSEQGVRVIGIPKTIDKDLPGTDYTLGFDTALRNITEVIERSRTPAGSHGWVQIVEVMGRHAGHLALWAGVAGQADLILIPEHPFRYEKVYRHLKERLGGIGQVLAKRIMGETDYDARSVMLGHPQRGGAPSPIDRIMGLMFGARAAAAVAEGEFGKMVSARGVAPACDLSLVDISSVLGRINRVDVERYYDTERYHLKGIGM